MFGFFGDWYVMVNILVVEIEVVENGCVCFCYIVVVGKIDCQMLILNSKIYELNFNLIWIVLVFIICKDLILKMKEDFEYLVKNKIWIFNWCGNEEIFWQQIDWNMEEVINYWFIQDLGQENFFGFVWINFYNKY